MVLIGPPRPEMVIFSTSHKYSPFPISSKFLPDFDESTHSYKWKGHSLPGVSGLLEKTGVKPPFDTFFWKKSLINKGMTDEEAEEYMIKVRDDACERGKEAHYSVELLCQNRPLKIDRCLPDCISQYDLSLYVMAAQRCLEELKVETVLGVEMQVVHPVGHYCGTLDALVETPDGIMVLDWKTTTEIKKAKTERWKRFQLVAYAAAINNIYKSLGACCVRVANAYLAPDGHKIVIHEQDEVLDTWCELQGLILEFWQLRVDQGQEYHSPELAIKALKAVEENWGPFE